MKVVWLFYSAFCGALSVMHVPSDHWWENPALVFVSIFCFGLYIQDLLREAQNA